MTVSHKLLSLILLLGLYLISSPASLAYTDPFAAMQAHFAAIDKQLAETRARMQQNQGLMNANTIQGISTNVQTSEDNAQYTVKMTMANLDQNSLDIQLENKNLRIKAEQKTEKQVGNTKSATYSAFAKTVFLPQAGDSTGLDVQTDGDTVIITVPKQLSSQLNQ